MIQQFIDCNNSKKQNIAVIGDTMIDDYKYGHVSRVSPEFPVQILTSKDYTSEQCPGGAANVCYQLTHFNADVFLLGFVDGKADCLYDKFKFNTDYCVKLKSGHIPCKTRFYDGDFPLLRWDIEEPLYGENNIVELRRRIFENFKELCKYTKLDAVILSDYDKGIWDDELAENIIEFCREHEIPTLVDPKRNLIRWCNCDIIKPNFKEATEMAAPHKDEGESPWTTITRVINCKSTVVTCGGEGVEGCYGNTPFKVENHTKLSAKEVNSVIGAGDCFIAVLALAVSHGLTVPEGCRIAFQAGVQYVKARHNKPITPHDIYARFDPVKAKIINLEDLVYLKENMYEGQTWAVTNGCYDLVHVAHIDTLRFAKSKADKLIVGLNSDASVKRLKGDTRPINTFRDRAYMLASMESVDYVVEFDEDTPEELIKKLKPDYLVKGGDYQLKDVIGADLVKEVFLAPVVPGNSTTNIIKKISGLSDK